MSTSDERQAAGADADAGGKAAAFGPVFRPGDPGYDAARAGYNVALDGRPERVVGAVGAEDVRRAVSSAANDDLAVGVQATGHGASVSPEGAVLITTRRMDRVAVDPVARTAHIAAGARWSQVLAATTAHGLAPLNGSSPDVGVVGYTLGGGIGPLGRRYGFAADHVRSLDVVTADGDLHHVSPSREPDLFWALRGGKGNFGVVVSMEIDLFPVARLFGGGLYFPLEAAAEVLDAYRQWAATVPDEMSSSVLLIRYPDDPGLPDPLRGRSAVHVRLAYSGLGEPHGAAGDREGERLVAPLRDVGPRLMDTVQIMPYVEVPSIYDDPTDPAPVYDRNLVLDRLDAGTVDTIAGAMPDQADPPLILELRHLGGAYARPPEVPNAVGHRDAAFMLFSTSVVEPGRLDDVRRLHNGLHERLRPWTSGRTLANFLGIDDTTPEQVSTAFAPADHARLAQIKATYDPDNRFRVNHNIPPASGTTGRAQRP